MPTDHLLVVGRKHLVLPGVEAASETRFTWRPFSVRRNIG